MLALVFVYPFNLNVEDAFGIDSDARAVQDRPCQVRFVLMLHCKPRFSKFRILRERFQVSDLILAITDPAISDRIGYQL